MKNKRNLKKIIVILAIIILAIIICMPKSFATARPSDITGDDEPGIEMTFMDSLVDMLTKIGIFTAVAIMMVLGIKYMTGSLEEKAEYKKTMLPYIIGCVLIVGASTIAPMIIDMFKDVEEVEDAGNIILGVIQVIGSFLAVGVVMVLGIKYMMGSTEERASYKRSMLPYVIGAVLLFGAVNLTAMVVDMATATAEAGETSDPRTQAGNCSGCGKKVTAEHVKRGKCPYCGYLFKRY